MSTTFEQVPTSDPIHRTREALQSSAYAAPGVVRILGISGSLRRDSYNRKLLHAAAQVASPTTRVELLDGLKALPPFDRLAGDHSNRSRGWVAERRTGSGWW
jgi:hypothetical protein